MMLSKSPALRRAGPFRRFRFCVHEMVKAAVAFGLIFDVSFKVLPAASTGRLSLAVLVLFYWRAIIRREFWAKFDFLLLVCFVLIAYSVMLAAVFQTDEFIIQSRFVWYLLYSLIGAALFVHMAKYDLVAAMRCVLLAIVVQAGFVFLSALSPEFRLFSDEALVQGGNLEHTNLVRFLGLTNGGGALLSVQLSIGAVAAYALALKVKSNAWQLLCLLAVLFLAGAALLAGRTGFYVCALIAVLMALSSPKFFFRFAFAMVVALALYRSLGITVDSDIDYSSNEVQMARTINWALDIFITGESSSLEDLIQNFNLDIGVSDFIFGSGRVFSPIAGNYAKSDSGYLQTIFAIGFLQAALFYSSLFLFGFYSSLSASPKNRWVGLLILTLVIVLELKEPFIHKYSLAFFSVSYWYLISRERRISEVMPIQGAADFGPRRA